jgi:alpha-galactosidase
MPFVIGVMGVDRPDAGVDTQEFRKAMAAPAALPEFKGYVVAVQTAPFWSEELEAIDNKRNQVRGMRHFLDSQHKNHANADGKMTEAQKREHVKKFEAELISPAEVALCNRGASNAGYHYLGCAKTFALTGGVRRGHAPDDEGAEVLKVRSTKRLLVGRRPRTGIKTRRPRAVP